MCGREGAGWSGGSPSGARPAQEPGWVLSRRILTWGLAGLPRQIPPGGVQRPVHTSLPTTLSPGQNRETEADGPYLEDQRSVNFCLLAFVHVGVLEALKSWVLVPGPVFSRRKGFKQERAPSGQGSLRSWEEARRVQKKSRKNKARNLAFLPTPPTPAPFRGLPGAHPATSPLPLVWPGWRRWLWASDTLKSPRSELRAWPPSQANSRRRGVLLECSGGRGEAQQGPGVGVDRGWRRVLSLLKAGEKLGLLTGLKGETVPPPPI